MKNVWMLIVLVGLGLVAWAQSPAAVVNGEPITQEELEKATQLNQILLNVYYQYPRFAQSLLSTPEGKAFLTRYQRDVLEDLILRRIQLQEAKARGLSPDPKRVEELVAQTLEYIKSYYDLTDEELEAELAQQGMTLEGFKEELRPQAEERALLELLKAQITKGVAVSEGEITAYYQEHPDQFQDDQGQTLPLEEVREKIAALLLSEKKEAMWQEWLRNARQNAEVQINL